MTLPDPLASLNLQAADKADVYCQACPEFNSWRSTRCGMEGLSTQPRK